MTIIPYFTLIFLCLLFVAIFGGIIFETFTDYDIAFIRKVERLNN